MPERGLVSGSEESITAKGLFLAFSHLMPARSDSGKFIPSNMASPLLTSILLSLKNRNQPATAAIIKNPIVIIFVMTFPPSFPLFSRKQQWEKGEKLGGNVM